MHNDISCIILISNFVNILWLFVLKSVISLTMCYQTVFLQIVHSYCPLCRLCLCCS